MAVTPELLGLIVVPSLWIATTNGAQSPDIQSFQILNTDVTSGQEVCPEDSLIVECIVTEAPFLEFLRNGMEIQPNFNTGDSPGKWNTGPYTLVLVSIDVDQPRRVANMTARLMVNISSLMSGNEITCAATLGKNSSKMLNYTLRGPPPAPVINTDSSVSLGKDNSSTFTISWNSSFTSANAITSYIISPFPTTITTEGEDVTSVNCPPSCPPNTSCQCTGLPMGGRVILNVSAVNCDTQEGEAVQVTVASSCLPNDLGNVDNTTDSRYVTIPNGVGCFQSTTVGSEATYKCDEGYSGDGSPRICLNNGTWSGSIPKCTEVSPQSSNQRTTIIIAVVVVVVVVLALVALIVILTVPVMKKRCRKLAPQTGPLEDLRYDPESKDSHRH